MPIVNFVREHIRFMEYAVDEGLSPSERLLWYALMHIMNQRAQGNVWPEEFIRVPNDRLLLYCPFKFDTVSAARHGLKQRGLIEYIPGEKNKKAPQYRMNYFCPVYAPSGAERDGEEGNTEFPDNLGGYYGGKDGGNLGGTLGGNRGDIYINYTENEGHIREDGNEEEEEEGARVREAFRQCFGRVIPAEADAVLAAFKGRGMETGVVEEAIRFAAEDGAGNPRAYVARLLDDWQEAGVRTALDVGKYAFLRDEMRGVTHWGTREEAENELKAMRERKKA